MRYLKYKKGSFIGLISSVLSEGEFFVRNLRKEKITSYLTFYRGKIVDKEIVCTISGIGKTNAAYATTILIERFSPCIIVNFGIGGAYPSSGLKIGDIAIAEKEIYGDEGVWLEDGLHTAEVIGIPFLTKGRKRYSNELQLDKGLIKKTMGIIPPHPPIIPLHPPLAKGDKGGFLKGGWGDFQVKSGSFITVSTCTGTLKRARELEKRFNAICENMEGAAVAHVCIMYGIPMVEIRGISNIVENRDTERWRLELATKNCQQVVIELLKIL
jgi:futalosine hydrolase